MGNKWHNFIDLYDSPNTRKQYRAAIKTFFKTVYGNEYESLEQTSDRYFDEDRDRKQDVIEFFKAIRERPPQVVRSRLSTVKIFLEMNEVDLPQKFWKMLKRKIRGSQAVSEEKVPTNKELRKILSHMRVKGRALFGLLASSGMRIGEATKLEFDDVHLDENPSRIRIRAEITKTGNSRTAFISDEATESLKQWLEIRDKWIEEAMKKSKFKKKVEKDNRIFPFSEHVAYQVWNRALDKAELNGVDKRTNRHKIHIHTLRKFFRSRMGTVIPKDIVEELIGHSDVYRKHSTEELAKFYKQGESVLTIFGSVTVNEKFSEMKEEHVAFRSVVTGLIEDKKKWRKERRQLMENIRKLQERLKKYEPLEPLALAVESKGGLPKEMAERLITQWMYEGLAEIELDEMEEVAPSKWRDLKPRPDFPREYLREEDGYKIYLVDGDEVIKQWGLKYFWGAHCEYFGFIPKGEIWIRKEGKDWTEKDIEETIKHELVEVKAMVRGVPYRKAHYLSDYSEKKWKENSSINEKEEVK